jgi:guanylate kinase
MVEKGEFVEWAEVHGNLYGTPRRNLEAAALAGHHVVLDIDVQGARQIRARFPEAVLVFVFPPTAEALWARLGQRGTEARSEVERRVRAARAELASAVDFDYIVVNQEIEDAVTQVRQIVEVESHRPSRARSLDGEVERLREAIDRLLA